MYMHDYVLSKDKYSRRPSWTAIGNFLYFLSISNLLHLCSLNHVLYQGIIDPTGTENWQNSLCNAKKIKSGLLLFVLV